MVKLKPSLIKFYVRHHDLASRYGSLCHRWSRICSVCRSQSPITEYFSKSNMTCATSRSLLTLPECLSSPLFLWCSCCSIFSILCSICGSFFFVILTFFFWPLYCLSFDLQYLQTFLKANTVLKVITASWSSLLIFRAVFFIFIAYSLKKMRTFFYYRIVPKSKRNIPRNRQIDTLNTHLRDSSLPWLGKCTSKKCGDVKLVLWTQTSPFMEIMRSCK